MTMAFRSHLDSHTMITQRIGAGLVRSTCTVCDHISVGEAKDVTFGAATIPAWMAAAADRFASSIDDDRVLAAA